MRNLTTFFIEVVGFQKNQPCFPDRKTSEQRAAHSWQTDKEVYTRP